MYSLFVSWLIAALLLLFVAFPATASTLFAVTSERNAAQIAIAAEQFSKQYPSHQLIFRTSNQLSELTDHEIRQWINTADSVLLAGVFGDSVPRLQKLLEQQSPQRLIAFNGDRRLTRLSYLKEKYLFVGIDEATLSAINQNPEANKNLLDHVERLIEQYPQQASWLTARSYWQARGSENMKGLIAWMLSLSDKTITPPPPIPQANIRYYQNDKQLDFEQLSLSAERPLVVLLDHDYADRRGEFDLHQQLCDQLAQHQLQCLSIMARWGASSTEALATIAQLKKQAPLVAIISLQDFIIGGSDSHKQADEWLTKLNVPILKGIRLSHRTQSQWQLSEDGMNWDSVHYQVAMPELQGISQPIVLASQGEMQSDKLTGLRFAYSQVIPEQVTLVASRVAKWHRLQTLNNYQKRLAIIYYNHPPVGGT